MLPLLLQYSRRYVLFAVAFLVIGVGAFWFGSSRASRKCDARMTAAESKTAVILARADAQYRERESTYEKNTADLRAKYLEAASTARQADTLLAARLVDGSQRMRVHVSNCRPVPASPAPSVEPSVGTDATASAELAPEVAVALWDIASEGDAAIEQLTALQAWAHEATHLCGGDK